MGQGGGNVHATASTSSGVNLLDHLAKTSLLTGKRRLAHMDTTLFDFEDGEQGWTSIVDTKTAGGYLVTATKHWSLASTLPGVDLVSTWWTNPNDGTSGAERSHVTSPKLTATCTNPSITFDSYTSNEPGTFYDVEHVQLSINEGPFTDVHGRTKSLHSSCDQTVRTPTFITNSGIEVGDFLKYRFLFDTYDGAFGCGEIVGWAFNNVKITCAIVPTDPPTPAPTFESVSHDVCENFAVHARTAVTFDGVMSTIRGGDVGVSPGTSITGSYTFEDGGVVFDSNDFADSVLVAHAAAMEVHVDEIPMDIEIGDKIFTPGTYRSSSAITFAYGTVVTLDGMNVPNPVFLFIAGSTLVTAADTSFILINGAKAENVHWALGTAATLGANSVFEGSILAGTAITFGTKSVLHGCALAQSAVTFESEGSTVLNHYFNIRG
jgi:hypothetical protein